MKQNKIIRSLSCVARYFAVVCVVCSVQQAMGQDTIKRRTLEEVSVTEAALPTVANVSAPTQVISIERLESQGVVQLSDAVRQMAGIAMKDYGGVGGIKTISVRGLGSQFSGLLIDGVAVNDFQNGQVDFGRYMLGNAAYVSHSNGQQMELLQTARAYAMGSMVQMVSKIPTFHLLRRTNLRVGIEGGSFGYASPSLLWEQRVGRRAVLSLWSNYVTSQGDYPFTLHYGPNATDSSSIERRSNSQVRIGTVDANLYVPFGDHAQLHSKAHYVRSYHALPGPVTFYNNIKSSEHSEEELFFLQSQYRRRFSEQWSMLLTGKVQRSTDIYEDTAARTSSEGFVHNEYFQQEYYLSGSVKWSPLSCLDMSLSHDGVLNQFSSNMRQNNEVSRLSNHSVLAASFHKDRVVVDGNLLATLVNEHAVTDGGSPRSCSYKRLSPYIGMTYRLGRGLRLRYFFKESYRVPSINEMYYFTMTRNLRPEKAMQHNVGITYAAGSYEGRELYATATLDGYYNRVSDKLIAIPMHNMFLWSMMNLGRVDILGADATVTVVWCEHPDSNGLRWTFTGNYSFQHAVDRTDVSQKTYGHQIPYTPRHSGNLSVGCETRWIEAVYTLQVVGSRYSMQQNTSDAWMCGYADHSIALTKRLDLPLGELLLRGQVQNIFDVQYEVVRSYPMMGRNWKIAAVWNF